MESIEETEQMLVMLEIDILTKCQHEYVLGLEEAYLYQNKLYMYLELCDGGGLDSIMQELQKASCINEGNERFDSEILKDISIFSASRLGVSSEFHY